MTTTHNVRIWAVKKHKGKTKTTYRVRWVAAGREFGESFQTSALADSFRAELLTAARKGEAFDVESGLPVSKKREQPSMTVFELACSYADMKWPDSSPRHRSSTAESLTRIVLAMLRDNASLPEGKTTRKALMIAFNTKHRSGPHPESITDAIQAVARKSRDVTDLAKPDQLRAVLHELDRNLDGARAASNTGRLRRVTLSGLLDFAVEKTPLESNPLHEVKTKKRTYEVTEVDPRSVVNPIQARTLLDAVSTVGKPGPPLLAFFGLMYYAALRPEEGASLRRNDIAIPQPQLNAETGEYEYGWGDLMLRGARPEIGEQWTDTGEASEERSLKHRADKAVRIVPCPPVLTKLLHEHLQRFGTARDGRLFRGARDGGRIGSTTYGRVWAKTREIVFTPEVAASPLAKRPYDLRHACVSTWLTGGVEPTRVAKWAGHSLAVLLRVYAKCLDGGEKAARERAERALSGW
ncbi:tyrosine-type recombinase/integrase [Amycolatopsis acidiphila]|uniref:Tyrosine-type recombinase/integrase n=1 Tax=Amycolatopsis acidiphila TaxID=715473 RepID=A0A558A3T9_9PSEU|nr:tyrosine-type recombinase/integrase [Amycolatopsis acidiphila]TVT18896.1 tyrosine-type recombinase/integrase [Amycolatopsis acidiphila]UIJ60593.1 tyrosine-type recombinase/integrase [Amycolatopsis acidiphila]GHG81907.1 integrase [Amycolatopsis acidiphila]